MEIRPKIELQLSPIDKAAETTGRCLIALLWILTIAAFFKMPHTIPTHFNASGQADIYGNKGTIFVLPIIATIIFIGLTILNRHPHVFNYLHKITEANAVYEYTIATRVLRFIKVFITIFFIIIVLSTFLIAIHLTQGLSSLFLPLIIALFSIPTVYSAVMLHKNK